MPADVNLDIDIGKKGDGDKEAALGLEALAKSADNAKDQLSQLDRKLLETRAAMTAAGKTFQETGDISPLKSLLKDERELSNVQKAITRGAEAIARDLENAGDQGGQGFITRFGHAVENGIASLPAPQGFVQWLVAGAVVASPLVGAAISAGVLLGVGGVGIAAGLAAAAQDARVRAAYADLGSYAKQQLIQAGSGFVDPAIRGADQIKQALGTLGPALKGDLDAVAPSLNNLIDGLTGFVEQMQAHGLGDAFEAAKPVIDALAAELPNMGQAMGDFFHDIAAGGPGAVQAIHDIATGINITVESTGALIEGLTKAYDFLINNPIGKIFSGVGIAAFEKLSHGSDTTQHSFQLLGAAGQDASDSIDEVGSAAGTTAKALEQAAQASTDLLRSWASAEQATIALDQAMLSMKDSVQKNGTSLEETSAKGLANRSALLQAAQAAETKREADIKAGQGAETANAQYATNIGTLRAAAIAAGFNRDQVDTMLHSLRQVPGDYAARVDVNGVDTAVERILSVKSALNSLQNRTVTVTTVQNTVTGEQRNVVRSSPAFNRWGGIYQHAAEGLLRDAQVFSAVSMGARYAFAEPATGGEAFVPKNGSPARSLAILSQAAGWYGAQVVSGRGRGGAAVPRAAAGGSVSVTLSLDAAPGSFEHAILSMIRAHVTNSGGNVQAALGRRGH